MTVPDWASTVQELIDQPDVSINQKCQKIMLLLRERHLLYDSFATPMDLIVHPKNRGGALVNPHDVVSKGVQISSVGWDRMKLREAVAIELPRDEGLRKHFLEINTRLAEMSEGRLAKPTGKERWATLSCSHTTAFVKAMASGCGPKCGLSLDECMQSGDDFAKLLKEGWSWRVLAAEVEERVPALPGLLQQGLNSDLAIGKPPSELEVAMCISQLYAAQPDGAKDLGKAVAAAGSSNPPCKPYISAIADFVQQFAGGESFKVLKYMDAMARSYAGSTMLGADFTKCLAYTDFKIATTRCPMTRIALALTQITAPANAVIDGFSRLLTKADFDRLKSKKSEADLVKAEALMQQAWAVVEAEASDKAHLQMAFCRYQIRIILYMLGKQTKGREAKEYDSLATLSSMFSQETLQVQPGQASQAAASSGEQVRDLEASNDQTLIAKQQNKHVKVGQAYLIKRTEPVEADKDKVFVLKDLQQDGATLEHRPFFGEQVQVEKVALQDLKQLKEWTKAVPALVEEEALQKLWPGDSEIFQDELARAEDQGLLYKKYLELGDPDVRPSNNGLLFCNCSYAKFDLQLYPLGQLQKVQKPRPQDVVIQKKGMKHDCYVVSPVRWDIQKSSGYFCPYWMIKEATESQTATLTRTTKKIGDMVVPVYQNKVALKMGDQLLLEPKTEVWLGSMQVTRQVILQYKGGPKVPVSEGLVHVADNGQQYLRFRPSSTSLTRAVLGHMEKFKSLKNPSLSCSPQVSQIRETVKAKILEMGSKEQNPDGSERDNLFDAPVVHEEEDSANEVTARKLREALERAPDVMKIDLGGKQVEVLKPRNWRETDILVKLEESDLEHVFDFLMVDVDSVYEKPKRPYVRSGRFAGKRKADEDDKQSDSG
ncbi:unnamed protein product [Symbiodinium sp. CCMP2592]|nr:unnamed protein product [Symbiodinium sp. CCMP2592]